MTSDSDQALRQELEDACANVRRQIEVQSSSHPYKGGYDNRNQMLCAELQAELTELEKALEDLGPADGEAS